MSLCMRRDRWYASGGKALGVLERILRGSRLLIRELERVHDGVPILLGRLSWLLHCHSLRRGTAILQGRLGVRMQSRSAE